MSSAPVWKTDGNGEVSAKYDPKTEVSSLSYKLTGPDVYELQTWRYTNTAVDGKDVIFDWDYSGFHAWFQASIKIALELKKKDGSTDTIILMEGPKRGNITGKGQEPASLVDCTEYSFVIQGKNFDRDARLFGTLKVKEIEDEDPKWAVEGPGEGSATYHVETDTSDLSYKLTGPEVHQLQTWRYTSSQVGDKDVVFDWDYSGFHAWYQATIKIALELKKKDGTVDTRILMKGPKRGNIKGNGQEPASLKDCIEYSFVIQGKNFDSDTRLFGTLKVKEIEEEGPNWETGGPGEVAAVYDQNTEISALSYKLTGPEVHQLQTWRFTNTDTSDKDLIFDWDYSGFHAWYKAWIKITLELTKKNGKVDTTVLMEGSRRGNITGKGQEHASLKDVAKYAFVIQGKNFDSDTRLFGTLNVKEIEDEDPEWKYAGPGEVSAIYDMTTDISDLSYKITGPEVHRIQTWRYTSTKTSDKEALFDWDYSGFHAWYRAWIKIVLELEKNDGTTDTRVLMEGTKRGNIKGKGQEAASLGDCKSFSFVIQGKNSDSDARLIGTLKVKET